MIQRIWHGWTALGYADAYETLLRTEILPGIQAKNVEGYRAVTLLRRPAGDEVEFITVMTFDSLEAVQAFAGVDYETAVVPPRAQALLSRFDTRSQHYEVRADERF